MDKNIDEKIKMKMKNKNLVDKYKLISKNVKRMSDTCEFKCLKCKNNFYMSPHNLINNLHQCTKCGRNSYLSYDDLKNKIKEITDNEYELISPYEEISSKKGKEFKNVNRNLSAKILHKTCGNIFSIRLTHFLSDNNRCTFCKLNKKLTNEEFNKKLSEVNPFFVLQSEYENRRKKVKCKCKKCGNITEDLAFNFITNKRGCSTCNMSKGEREILYYLENKKINFIKEKKFNDLIIIKPLRFDFYLPENNILIEYDGEQHFQSNNSFYESLDNIIIKDNMKNNYAINKKIILIRISYLNFKKLHYILSVILNSSTTIETLNILKKENNILIIDENGNIFRKGIYKKE